MIIPKDAAGENIFIKIFDTINKIFSNINKVKLDYTTLSIRINSIERSIFYGIFNIVVALIDPSLRVCAIDSTGLRSSNYDSEAQYGVGTRLGTYKGYKLHLVASADDTHIPIAFTVTTAEVYDNKASDILYMVNKDIQDI